MVPMWVVIWVLGGLRDVLVNQILRHKWVNQCRSESHDKDGHIELDCARVCNK